MVDLKEITMVNGIAMFLMWFLLRCRRKNRESINTEDKLYDAMAIVCFVSAFVEIGSFYVDASPISVGRCLNYLTNSLCYMGSVTVGLLWCLYVDLRVRHNYRKVQHSVKILMIPWVIEVIAITYNLMGTGFMFTVSEENVYHRTGGACIGYISLAIYLAYSVYLVMRSKGRNITLNFFPVFYFIVPCFLGMIIQACFYGLSASWVSVAIALIFVQMQAYAESIYTDELSGLYNRRYLKGILAKHDAQIVDPLYGIMMDINNFKNINDNFGHSAGDRAIVKMGDILHKSISDASIAIRYAGDEFIVLLSGTDEQGVLSTMGNIEDNLRAFNTSGEEQFHLSVAMGYAVYGPEDDSGTFLSHMDESMYEEKRKYHMTDL